MNTKYTKGDRNTFTRTHMGSSTQGRWNDLSGDNELKLYRKQNYRHMHVSRRYYDLLSVPLSIRKDQFLEKTHLKW